jgi:hypothetical protein
MCVSSMMLSAGTDVMPLSPSGSCCHTIADAFGSVAILGEDHSQASSGGKYPYVPTLVNPRNTVALAGPSWRRLNWSTLQNISVEPLNGTLARSIAVLRIGSTMRSADQDTPPSSLQRAT